MKYFSIDIGFFPFLPPPLFFYFVVKKQHRTKYDSCLMLTDLIPLLVTFTVSKWTLFGGRGAVGAHTHIDIIEREISQNHT